MVITGTIPSDSYRSFFSSLTRRLHDIHKPVFAGNNKMERHLVLTVPRKFKCRLHRLLTNSGVNLLCIRNIKLKLMRRQKRLIIVFMFAKRALFADMMFFFYQGSAICRGICVINSFNSGLKYSLRLLSVLQNLLQCNCIVCVLSSMCLYC